MSASERAFMLFCIALFVVVLVLCSAIAINLVRG